MKTVVFERIRIRNFLSFGNQPIEFNFDAGVNFITGFNKDKKSFNGVGKTALIVESLSFAIFGDCYRKINQKTIRHEHNNETCSVELYLKINNVPVYINRNLHPNTLILEINGVDKKRTITETDKDIVDLLGISKDVFMNTLVMTNKDTSVFFSKGKTAKAEFIESILNLEVFSEMHDEAKATYNALGKQVSNEEVRVGELERVLTSDIAYSETEERRRKNAIQEAEYMIAELKAVQPVDLTDDIKKMEKDIDDADAFMDDLNKKIKAAEIKKAGLNEKMRSLGAKLKEFDSAPKSCPMCKRSFEEHTPKDFSEEIRAITEEIKTLKVDYDKYQVAISKAESKISERKRQKTENISRKQILTGENQRYQRSQDRINTLVQQLHALKEHQNPFSEKIQKGRETLDKAKETLKNLKYEHKIQEGVKFMTSPLGVKTVILKRIIKTFNDRLAFYLKRLDAPCRCEFDEFFEETFYSEKTGKVISYGNLSGGESKRVDFALLFTFRVIRSLQSNIYINLSVFDELFDSALDNKAMCDILDLLKEMAEENGESYYIISHRPEAIEIEGCKTIHLEKYNGVTTIL